jgi:hypothetical protein
MRTLLRRLGLTTYPFWIGGIAGLVAGLGTMLVAFPFLFPPPVVDEPATATNIITGESLPFTFDARAPGRDLVHWADGSGALIRTQAGWVLRFNGDFRAGPGPNYWIYLNTVPVGEKRAFRSDQGRVRIAALKSFRGGQNYSLPSELDPAHFHTVTIWCESFGVYIGSAAFQVSLNR